MIFLLGMCAGAPLGALAFWIGVLYEHKKLAGKGKT